MTDNSNSNNNSSNQVTPTKRNRVSFEHDDNDNNSFDGGDGATTALPELSTPFINRLNVSELRDMIRHATKDLRNKDDIVAELSRIGQDLVGENNELHERVEVLETRLIELEQQLEQQQQQQYGEHQQQMGQSLAMEMDAGSNRNFGNAIMDEMNTSYLEGFGGQDLRPLERQHRRHQLVEQASRINGTTVEINNNNNSNNYNNYNNNSASIMEDSTTVIISAVRDTAEAKVKELETQLATSSAENAALTHEFNQYRDKAIASEKHSKHRIEKLEAEVNQFKRSSKESTARLTEVEEAKNRLVKEKTELVKQIKEKGDDADDIIEKLQNKVFDLTKQFNDKTSELAVNEQELQKAKEVIRELSGDVDEQVASYILRVEQLEGDMDTLRNELEEKDAELQVERDTAHMLQLQLAQYHEAIGNIDADHNNNNSNSEVAFSGGGKSLLAEVDDQRKEAEEERAQLSRKHAGLTEAHLQAVATIKKLGAQLSQAKRSKASSNADIHYIQKLQSELSQTKSDLEACQAENSRLQRNRGSMPYEIMQDISDGFTLTTSGDNGFGGNNNSNSGNGNNGGGSGNNSGLDYDGMQDRLAVMQHRIQQLNAENNELRQAQNTAQMMRASDGDKLREATDQNHKLMREIEVVSIKFNEYKELSESLQQRLQQLKQQHQQHGISNGDDSIDDGIDGDHDDEMYSHNDGDIQEHNVNAQSPNPTFHSAAAVISPRLGDCRSRINSSGGGSGGGSGGTVSDSTPVPLASMVKFEPVHSPIQSTSPQQQRPVTAAAQSRPLANARAVSNRSTNIKKVRRDEANQCNQQ